MLPEIIYIHCFLAISCQKHTKNMQLSTCVQKLQLSLASLEFKVKTVLKSFNFQMLKEITIIHCFIAIYCQKNFQMLSELTIQKTYHFQMLTEILHCFLAIYCQNGTKNT